MGRGWRRPRQAGAGGARAGQELEGDASGIKPDRRGRAPEIHCTATIDSDRRRAWGGEGVGELGVAR